MGALRLFLIRHGETEWSRERRFTGTRDVPLTARGRRQGAAVAAALADLPVAALYASPLARARVTAEAIAGLHRLEVRVAPGLREMAFGDWEGLTRAEVATLFSEPARAWGVTPHLVTPPAGESLAGVAVRATAATDGLRQAHAGETVVVVSHAIVVRLVVLAALGLGPDRLWSVEVSPAGITEIEYAEDWTVVHRMNTLSHLEGRGLEVPVA